MALLKHAVASPSSTSLPLVATRIYLTGRIAVEHDGRVRVDERDLPGRQGRLAFVHLVAYRHRPTRRDDLMDVLWGDAPPQECEVTSAPC